MKFKKITYRIDDSHGRGGRSKKVTGYAMDFYPVRLCVRQVSKRSWVIDHYDTGCSIHIGWLERCRRDVAAIAAARKVFHGLISGSYQTALLAYEERVGAA